MAKAPDPKSPPPQERKGSVTSDPRDIEEAAQTALVAAGVGDGLTVDSGLAVSLTRAEIDQQIATAHAYPRSMANAIRNIISLATNDSETARECVYSLPRGFEDDPGNPGKKRRKFIEGPSIRLAELIAQQWGNNRVGARVTAVDLKAGFVEAEGLYHDLETNSATGEKVRRSIKDSHGRIFNQDMIIVTGNAARAIARRNAILAGVPKPIWRQAYVKAQQAIAGEVATLGSRRVEMLKAFHTMGIKAQVVYQLLGVGGEEDIGLDEFVQLAGLYTAIKNGEATVEDLLGQTATGGERTLDAAFGGATVTRPQEPQGSPQAAGSTAGAADTGKTAEPASGQKTGAAADVKAVVTPIDADGVVLGDDEPGGEGAKVVNLNTARPAQEPTPEPGFPRPLRGYADPDEVYHFADDVVGEDGKLRTYKNGELFSRSGPKAGLKVYTDHPPADGEKAPTDQGEEERRLGEPEPQVRSNPEDRQDPGAGGPQLDEPQYDVAAFNEFAAKMRSCESWLSVKAGLSAFRRTTAYAEAPEQLQTQAKLLAYTTTVGLIQAGDPVRHTEDPTFFGLWLLQAPAHEKRPAFSQLIRSKAYQALPDAAKDAIAEEVGKGEV